VGKRGKTRPVPSPRKEKERLPLHPREEEESFPFSGLRDGVGEGRRTNPTIAHTTKHICKKRDRAA
jgi:hypothetical protein